MEHIVILITAKDMEEAEKISEILVGQKLVACVNMINGIHSVFLWENNVERGEEVLLIAKTRKELFKPVEEAVKRAHSYSVPEIIALPVIEGSQKYLEWVTAVTAVTGERP